MYLLFVLVFIIQKLLFMWYYHGVVQNAKSGDYLQVMLHGLPLTLSIAGLSVIIFLLCCKLFLCGLRTLWTPRARRLLALISFCNGHRFVSDMALYSYWGSVWILLRSLFLFITQDALASEGIGVVIAGFAIMAVLTVLFYLLFFSVLPKSIATCAFR